MSKDLVRDNPKFPNQELRISLPLPESVNAMYIRTRNGVTLTRKAKQWVNTARYLAQNELCDQDWNFESGNVWITCDLNFYFPDKRKRDNHNYFKLLFDALEGFVYINDYFVKPRVNIVTLDKESPRVEMIFRKENKEP